MYGAWQTRKTGPLSRALSSASVGSANGDGGVPGAVWVNDGGGDGVTDVGGGNGVWCGCPNETRRLYDVLAAVSLRRGGAWRWLV